MSSRSDSEKIALRALKAAHRAKYGAPLGKRKCKSNTSEDCLGIGPEEEFNGHRCRECIKLMHRELYSKRLEAAGKVRVGKGRPKGAKDKQKRKSRESQ